MTSKIDLHSELVFEQLNEFGMSYRAVSDLLLKRGIEVSHQAVRLWYLRRTEKIKKRKAVFLGASDRASSNTLNASVPPAPRPPKPAVFRPTVRTASTSTLASNQFNEFQESIDKELENFERNPFSSSNTKFLIQRRG
jgi:hypothetical protein